MVVWLTRQRTRVILVGIALLCGFVPAEVGRLSYTSAGALACFAFCLAALIGSGKQASP